MNLPVMSAHAVERSIQRNVDFEEVVFVVEHGYSFRRAGGLFYQLRQKSVPRQYAHIERYRQLVGTTVLMCGKCRRGVITIYRNERAFRKDNKKTKYNRRNSYCCPCCNNTEYLPDAA